MAGYMTKLIGNVYEGELVNGAANAVPNGILMVQGTGDSAGALVLPATDSSSKFVCKEVGSIYDGVPAYRFIADKLAKRYYFIENGFDINDSLPYDKRTYTTAVDAYLRAHPMQVGEEFWTTQVTGVSVDVGSVCTVAADGSLA